MPSCCQESDSLEKQEPGCTCLSGGSSLCLHLGQVRPHLLGAGLRPQSQGVIPKGHLQMSRKV